MRTVLVLLAALAMGVLPGCASTYLVDSMGSPRPEALDSPCNDSLYVVLRSRSLEDLTEREYQYLMEKERQCAGYRDQSQIERTKKSAISTYVVVAMIAIGTSVALAVN